MWLTKVEHITLTVNFSTVRLIHYIHLIKKDRNNHSDPKPNLDGFTKSPIG